MIETTSTKSECLCCNFDNRTRRSYNFDNWCNFGTTYTCIDRQMDDFTVQTLDYSAQKRARLFL